MPKVTLRKKVLMDDGAAKMYYLAGYKWHVSGPQSPV